MAPRTRLALLDAALLAILIVIAFWKLTLSTQFTFLEAPDIANQVLPWLDLQARALREGRIALWDPYLLGGQPLVGQLQPGVTSPFTYLLLALPLRNGHLCITAVHWWFVLLHGIAGLFAWLLCREFGLGRAAAIFGGLFFAIGGYNGNTAWPQYFAGSIWSPLIALFLYRSVQGIRPLPNAAMGGLFLGLSWLSGHHQIPLFQTIAVVVSLSAIAFRRRRWPVALAVCLAAAAAVSAVQVLPAMEYGRASVRWVDLPEPVGWSQKVPYEVHQTNALGAAGLLFTVIPGGVETISNPIIGVVALSLALLAVAMCFDRPLTRYFLALSAVSLLFAMARNNLFHGVLYSLLPMIEKARSPATLLALTQFGVSMLAAFGLDAAITRGLNAWVRRVPSYLIAFTVAVFVALPFEPALIKSIDHGADRLAMVAVVALVLAGAYVAWYRRRIDAPVFVGLVFALLLIEQGNSLGYDYRRFDDRTRPAVLPRLYGGTGELAKFLRAQPGPARVEFQYNDLLFNFGEWHGIEAMAGYVPGVLASNYALGWWDQRVRELYGVRYSIAQQPRAGQREIFAANGMKIFEDPSALPRAWTVHRAVLAKDEREAAQMVQGGAAPLREQAVLTGGAPKLEQCSEPDTVEVTRQDLHSTVLRARMACRGLVVVSENWFPGWEATVDGRPETILPAYVSLRAVAVDAGSHEIVMRYRPRSVYLGLAITLAGLAGVFIVYRMVR
ncbi:MAG: YfhO family protein [Bryobacteraceae bacterium]